jgi:titin
MSYITAIRSVFAGLLFGVFLSSAGAATIIVTSNADTGTASSCVLRDAITAANTAAIVNGCAAGQAATTNAIHFSLGAGALTIAPASALPTIVTPMVIDGYSQTGAMANDSASATDAVLKVVLDGSNAGNSFAFELLQGSSGSTIRGLVISGFAQGGIHINGSSNNTVAGNFFGTDAAGSASVGNASGRGAIWITAGLVSVSDVTNNNSVGGVSPADRNLISGNFGGITMDAFGGGIADGNTVAGNLFGTDASGSSVLPTFGSVIQVLEDVTNTTIGLPTNTTFGGACSGGCNLFGLGAIEFGEISTATNNTITIQYNMIGLKADGSGSPSFYPSSTSLNGVSIDGSGTYHVDHNVIANTFEQVFVNTSGFTATVSITGNRLGTNSAGTATAGPGISPSNRINIYGVYTSNTSGGVTVGGPNAGDGNLISGLSFDGIYMEGSQNVVVQGNMIGTKIDGTSGIGNGSNGIEVRSTTGAIIGAATSGGAGGNTIAYNGKNSSFPAAGVMLIGNNANRVSTNSIFSNAGSAPSVLGIDLGDDGVTPNQPPCSAGLGANNLQNYPSNIGFSTSAGVTHVTGTLAAEASTTYTIEFYASPSADPSGYGQGKTYVGSTTVTTSAAPICAASFNATTSVPVSNMNVVSAIAIDPSGNTSEFSQALDRIFANGFDGD